MAVETAVDLSVMDLVFLLAIAGLAPVSVYLLVRRLAPRATAPAAADDDVFRAIVERQADMLVLWKPDGTCIWANEHYCRFMGFAPGYPIGRNLLDLVGDAPRKRLLKSVSALSPERPRAKQVAEYPGGPGGESFWLEWVSAGSFDAEGRLSEIQSVGRDITSRMKALKALEASEARFRGFVESTSDWVWETDADGRDVYSNRQVTDILGYEPAELIHMHWKELAHPDDIEATQAEIAACRREGRGWKRMVCRLRHKDGSYRYLESTADPIFDESNRVVGFRGIDRDATFETLMAKISADLVGRAAAELDRRIERALEEIALCYSLERIAFCWLDGDFARASHFWSTVGREQGYDVLVPSRELPSAFRTLLGGSMFRFASTLDLPEGSPEHRFMTALGVRSSIAIPMFRDEELVGYAVFSVLSSERTWSRKVETELSLLSDKIAAAYSLSQSTQETMRRERDRIQSEALAGMGSYSYYPTAASGAYPDGWRTYFSDEQCELFEVSPGEASHEVLLSRVHDEDRARVYEAMARLRGGASDIELQYRIVNPSGRVLHLLNRTRADRDVEGRIVRVIGYNLNVTEQVNREASLQAAVTEIQALREQLEQENVQLREAVRSIEAFEQIVGESAALRECLELISMAAPTSVPILITGETGTGKELVAKAVHNLSSRTDGVMVSINCSALPGELVESELFGHEKGAFTGAHESRAGRFEVADGGTLFLDEIAEMPLELQAKLLRVLEDGSFERVGSTQTKKVDVRLVAATNRDLEQEVREGRFRADLYYRLNTMTVSLPPLRDRKEDIPLLAHHFVMKHGPRLHKAVEYVSADTLRFLQAQDWPGNVRELEHFIERALISTHGSVLRLPSADSGKERAENYSIGSLRLMSSDLRSVERGHILNVLQDTDWMISGENGAAARLNIPPSTLRSKMKRLGIRREPRSPHSG